MRIVGIISGIELSTVIKKILAPLGVWPAPPHSPPAAGHPLPWSLQRVVAA